MSPMSTCIVQGVDALMKSLDALQPTAERTITAKFTTLYTNIEQALARGVTQRAVMEALERDGLKLHPAKFKKLLDEARTQRNAYGEGTRCPVCGSIQPTPLPTEAQLQEEGEK